MRQILTTLLLSTLLLCSCSKDDDSDGPSGQKFTFISFTEDVIVSEEGYTDIKFYAVTFDKNKANWNITVADENGATTPASIQAIEQTRWAFSVESDPLGIRIFQIDLRTAAPLATGSYHLSITNNVTGQMFADQFLVVKSNDVENIVSESKVLFYILDDPKPILVQGKNVYIKPGKKLSEVTDVYLQSKDNLQKYGFDFTVKNGELVITIPDSFEVGYYYISLIYNHVLADADYYKFALAIDKQVEPVIESVNKDVFGPSDEIIVTGKNLRYPITPSLLPGQPYVKPIISASLVFSDDHGSGTLYESHDEITINKEGTELRCLVSKVPFVSYNDRNDFTGFITADNGAYASEKEPISIVRSK